MKACEYKIATSNVSCEVRDKVKKDDMFVARILQKKIRRIYARVVESDNARVVVELTYSRPGNIRQSIERRTYTHSWFSAFFESVPE